MKHWAQRKRNGGWPKISYSGVITERLQSEKDKLYVEYVPKPNAIDVCRNFLTLDLLKTNQEADGLSKSSPETIGIWKNCLLSDIATKFNEGRPDPLNKRTIQHNLHKHNYRRI